MIDETKEEFLTVLREILVTAEDLRADCLAGRRGDRPESAEELRIVMEELRDLEGRVLRGEPMPDFPARVREKRLGSARIALDWNYSPLAYRVMELSRLYTQLE